MADEKRRRDDTGEPLPIRLRSWVIGGFAVLLAIHIFVDIFKDDYEGTPISLMLGSIIGTALGITEVLRGRGGGS